MCSAPKFERVLGFSPKLNEDVYIIDDNGFDIWEGKIQKAPKETMVFHYKYNIDEDEVITRDNVKRILKKTPINSQIYTLQEKKRDHQIINPFDYTISSYSEDMMSSDSEDQSEYDNESTDCKEPYKSMTFEVEPQNKNLSIIEIPQISECQNDLKNIFKSFLWTSMKPDQRIILDHGTHPVFHGFLWAYKNHRPITISPDIIWLLIIQAFSNHISENFEELRSRFVNFDRKKELTVSKLNLNYHSLTPEDWEQNLFPEFVEQISIYTGKSIIETLTPEFSTTTPVSLAVGQLTIMSAMKNYFKYRTIVGGCGLPYVTIEGSIEDWTKIQNKLENLKNYEFGWFVDNVKPIIEKIIQTKKGNIDKQFWMRMIRIKDPKGFYKPTYVDGWFTAFFPYNDGGFRIFDKITITEKLQHEVQKIPFTLNINYFGIIEEKKCEFIAGFVGLTQNPKNASIKPEIGWLIREVEK